VLWLRADGAEMTDADWADASRLSVGMLLDGTRIGELDHEGQPIVGDSLYVFLNASAQAVTMTLPQVPSGGTWEHVLDTNDPAAPVATSGPATVQVVAPQAVRIYRG
jgi:isoamylase